MPGTAKLTPHRARRRTRAPTYTAGWTWFANKIRRLRHSDQASRHGRTGDVPGGRSPTTAAHSLSGRLQFARRLQPTLRPEDPNNRFDLASAHCRWDGTLHGPARISTPQALSVPVINDWSARDR